MHASAPAENKREVSSEVLLDAFLAERRSGQPFALFCDVKTKKAREAVLDHVHDIFSRNRVGVAPIFTVLFADPILGSNGPVFKIVPSKSGIRFYKYS